LRTSAAAVLLVASERKAEKLRDAMHSRGIAPERLKALHAPAGPHIHAHTPLEIALGAVAGLVALRRELEHAAADACAPCTAGDGEGDNAVPGVPPCESMASVESVVARYINPVCGMPVDIALAKHVVDHGGQRVYFCCDGCKIEFERLPEKYLAIARGSREWEKT